ncbi:7717_t:CDS:2 [Acaulospora morrowiae]|uniref:7717_t:CDS:1 n=1 Tax=Acaulospora morrowiae TaxID=94023 RepID=A0A9N9BD60_9GLOM|nr:7717_t:CDS:2 [Acaulospora morrowiae]
MLPSLIRLFKVIPSGQRFQYHARLRNLKFGPYNMDKKIVFRIFNLNSLPRNLYGHTSMGHSSINQRFFLFNCPRRNFRFGFSEMKHGIFSSDHGYAFPRLLNSYFTNFKKLIPKNRISKYSLKLFRNTETDSRIVSQIMVANVLVFLSWKLAELNYEEHRNITYLNFMYKHFTVSINNIRESRWWTVLTCAFSHKDFGHLAVNMFALWGFGRAVLQMLGTTEFLLVYLGSALTASLGHLSYTYFSRSRKENVKHYVSAMGASGSIMGLSSLYALTFPSSTFLIFFVIPAPAIVVVGLYAFYDIYRTWTKSHGNVGSAGHLAGTLFGLIYYWRKIRRGRFGTTMRNVKNWRGRIH